MITDFDNCTRNNAFIRFGSLKAFSIHTFDLQMYAPRPGYLLNPSSCKHFPLEHTKRINVFCGNLLRHPIQVRMGTFWLFINYDTE